MKIDAKGYGLIFLNESFDIELLILKHLQGDINNPYLEAVAFQIFREAGKSNGIHFKDGSGGNDIADRAMDPRALPEVIEGRRMEKD